jgi:iron complex outermembrane receptor protein
MKEYIGCFLSFLVLVVPAAQAELSIVVTAKPRSLDEMGGASTTQSISGQQLHAAGVMDTPGLQAEVPGLVARSSGGMGDFYLRGIGGITSATSDPGIPLFVDGVYLTHPTQSLFQLYDIDHVDVTKGPQNTCLGRNGLAGAININTQDPLPDPHAYADVFYGTTDTRQFRGAVNLPFSDKDWSFRLAGTGIAHDGFSRNVFLNKDVDTLNTYAWRGKLRYHPSNKLDVIFNAAQSKERDSQGLAAQPNSTIGVDGGILLGGTVPDDPRKVTDNVDDHKHVNNSLYSAKAIWRVGDIEIKSLTAFQSTNFDMGHDLDGTQVDFSSNFPTTEAHAFSQEIRASSPQDQVLAWTVGSYVLHRSAAERQDVRFPLASFQTLSESNVTHSSYAVFGDLAYLFSPAWRARAGLRYSHDRSSIDLTETITDPVGTLGSAGTQTARFQDQQSWGVFTPELALSFRPDVDTLCYASVSRGYKSGGYNDYAIQPSFAPEYLWAYEAGIKAALTRQLSINAALFYYDYTNIQLSTLPPNAPAGTLPLIGNAPSATVRGAEVQASYRAQWNLGFSLGATFLDARFRKFVSVDPNNPTDDSNRAGDPLPLAPHASLVLASDYLCRLERHGDLKLHVSYRYQSEVYFNPYSDPAVRQGAYSLLGTTLTYSGHRDDWYAELYGDNLTNRLYAQNFIRLDPVIATTRLWGSPRTVGVRLGYRL